MFHWAFVWSSAEHFSGKAIAIRLAEDGFDVCINDVPANQAGIDEVRTATLQ